LTRKSFLKKKFLKYRRKDSNTDRQTDRRTERQTMTRKSFLQSRKLIFFYNYLSKKTFKYRSINI
jgi:hypothetical protein